MNHWASCAVLLTYSARGLLKKFDVEYAAPCAGSGDDLSGFAGLKGIVPSLRGD